MDTTKLFGTEKISRILFRLAPPVMLAQLIQALYNIIDSLFVGRYSGSGLTALSIIYPIQLLMIALAVGTGVGINTAMAAKLGVGENEKADEYAGVGTPLAVVPRFLFAAISWCAMPAFAKMSTDDPAIIADVVVYGRIVCVFSFGLFLESIWTKVLQAGGDMKTPMIAQIAGAVTNIVLDPLLIFGMLGLPEMGMDEEKALPLVVKAEDRHRLIGKRRQNKIKSKYVERIRRLHQNIRRPEAEYLSDVVRIYRPFGRSAETLFHDNQRRDYLPGNCCCGSARNSACKHETFHTVYRAAVLLR